MNRKFQELRNKMPPLRRILAEYRARNLISEMRLSDIRISRQCSQEQIAITMQTNQPSVSKLENRHDMLISTLRSYIKAMGGELEIVARFPKMVVKIIQ